MAEELPALPPSFAKALELIDEAHALDPTKTAAEGRESTPYELHYAQKMTRWLAVRCPSASPTLQLACRAQHFQRWLIPRDSYPSTRAGYLMWRAKSKKDAASRVSEVLASPSIDPPLAAEDISRVSSLIAKENLDTDEETQILEDVACLVFLDDQLDDFQKREGIDEEKIVGILKKTWAKMSERGREIALQMDLSDQAKRLIASA